MTRPLHIHHHPDRPPAVTVESLVEWLKDYQLLNASQDREDLPDSTRAMLQGGEQAICRVAAALGVNLHTVLRP